MVHGPVLTLEERDPALPGRFSYTSQQTRPQSSQDAPRKRGTYAPASRRTQTNVWILVVEGLHRLKCLSEQSSVNFTHDEARTAHPPLLVGGSDSAEDRISRCSLGREPGPISHVELDHPLRFPVPDRPEPPASAYRVHLIPSCPGKGKSGVRANLFDVPVDRSGHQPKLKIPRTSLPDPDVGLNLCIEVLLVPHLHSGDVPGADHVRGVRFGVSHRCESKCRVANRAKGLALCFLYVQFRRVSRETPR